MLVKVYVRNYSLTSSTMLVIYRGEVYEVAKRDVVRNGDNIAIDDSKLTEDSKVQAKDR